jgi:RNA-directed DNA polymerase
VNRDKSAVAPVGERKFLGHRLLLNGKLGIAPKSVKRAKEKIRQITSRNRGASFAQVILELNLFLVGWLTYYRLAAFRGELIRMDEWIRRKLRCYRLKQRKRGKSLPEVGYASACQPAARPVVVFRPCRRRTPPQAPAQDLSPSANADI